MIDLNGKCALVTGGSRGIGRACCLMLARAGASVAVNYRVETPSASLLVEEIEAAGGEAFALAADVSKRDDAEMLVDETVAKLGSIDILVNNAGIWGQLADRGDVGRRVGRDDRHQPDRHFQLHPRRGAAR